jgi:hypothetical protein
VNGDPVYVLDANVFIEAARRYYAFDLVPAFWTNLVNLAAQGRIKSIDKIKQELERGNDDLADWIKRGNMSNAFASTDQPDVIRQFGEMMEWVQDNDQFLDAAKAEFAGGVDGWLIAYAGVNNYTVVTHEVYARDVRNRVPIPNICRAFDVRYTDTFQMLRDLGVRFV